MSVPIRLRRPMPLVAEPILYRRTANPSRRRIVRSSAQGPFFGGAKPAPRADAATPGGE
jgi:hypothetical protein